VFYRFWLCKKIKSNVTLKDIDVEHEGMGHIGCEKQIQL
jgi:hypothetical protein